MKRILMLTGAAVLLFFMGSCADGGMMGTPVPVREKAAAEEIGVPRIVPIRYVHGSNGFTVSKNIPMYIQYDGMVEITTKTAIGDAADQCPIKGDGKDLEIGFNNKYLMDALKNAPADRLRLEFNSGVAPCVILPTEGEENFIYMVLPVRLKAN